MILHVALFLVTSLLVYLVGRQIGIERGTVHGALVCQTQALLAQQQLLLHQQQQREREQQQMQRQQSLSVSSSSKKCAKKPSRKSARRRDSPLCPRGDPETAHPMHVVKGKASTPEDVFSFLHHPASPAKFNFYFSQEPWRAPLHITSSPCQEVFLTRTGSRANQPNKCVSVAVVPRGFEPMNQQSYRVGYTALNTDQYQQDYPREYGKKPSAIKSLLEPMLQELDDLKAEFRRKVGDPIDPVTGKRRHVIVMVANEGVMDLLLNFLCSAEMAEIFLSTVVVFVGDARFVSLIERTGAHAIYAPSMGAMPKQAAGFYMDQTFSRMMWCKTTSVYLALAAGFEVLFQDVDLVWLRSPYAHFETLEHDMIFMDDGARTPRYTPFFVNSGFYFVKHNERTLYLFETFLKHAPEEISLTHSHQSVLIKHIAEAHHLVGLKVFVLDSDTFASGQTYHENKPLVRKIQARAFAPFVFHMCWTENRENKVVFFKDIGLWFLPDNDQTCSSANHMQAYSSSSTGKGKLLDHCCQRDRYWSKQELLGPEERSATS